MKTLHIFRSEPVPMTIKIVRTASSNGENGQFKLYQEDINYDRLVNEIFSSDRVICWW
ncbi:MAG: hypothetical protein QG578_1348 [Thermodesulfobacteriota bacterium]|nr:hypothetical protein [Thermodesulfobacteriota bacterium]